MAFQVQRRKRGGRPTYRKKGGVFATSSGFSPSGAGSTRKSVLAAAEVFAQKARDNAARFSRRIPAATHVEELEDQTAQVVTDGKMAPNAAPFEFGERHPLNWPDQINPATGRSDWWRKQPKRPYMANAARNPKTRNEAADVYGQLERDMLAEEYGYTE